MATKSGTNSSQYRLELIAFRRWPRTAINAKVCQNPFPPTNSGYSFGGPIEKDKLFSLALEWTGAQRSDTGGVGADAAVDFASMRRRSSSSMLSLATPISGYR
jgi:hypothetical protein